MRAEMVAPAGVGQNEETTLSLEARVSQVVVRTMKDLYGRGPTHAKTFFCDEYVFCVLSGGMTRDEETMVGGGEHEAVVSTASASRLSSPLNSSGASRTCLTAESSAITARSCSVRTAWSRFSCWTRPPTPARAPPSHSDGALAGRPV